MENPEYKLDFAIQTFEIHHDGGLKGGPTKSKQK